MYIRPLLLARSTGRRELAEAARTEKAQHETGPNKDIAEACISSVLPRAKSSKFALKTGFSVVKMSTRLCWEGAENGIQNRGFMRREVTKAALKRDDLLRRRNTAGPGLAAPTVQKHTWMPTNYSPLLWKNALWALRRCQISLNKS